MSVHQQLTHWAYIIAIAASANGAFGNRSVMGDALRLRAGRFWRLTRYVGLTLFVLGVVGQNLPDGNPTLALIAILGASGMAVGTARKRVRLEVRQNSGAGGVEP